MTLRDIGALALIPESARSSSVDLAQDILRTAYQAQGIRALESTKRGAAIHEAGHCVVKRAQTRKRRRLRWTPALTPEPTSIWRSANWAVWCPSCSSMLKISDWAVQWMKSSSLPARRGRWNQWARFATRKRAWRG